MNEKDLFFAQNWIEQFRSNILAHPYNRGIYSATDAFTEWECGREVIHESFSWRGTPEHYGRDLDGPWRWREMQFGPRNMLTR